jgi:hypothetical protein
MIRNEDITSFAIDTGEALKTRFVGGLLNDKGEIDGDALIADGSTARIVKATSMFVKLGGSTDRTLFSRISGGKGRDTDDKFVHGGSATEVQMGKTLMPEKTELIARKAVKNVFRGRRRSRGRRTGDGWGFIAGGLGRSRVRWNGRHGSWNMRRGW